MIKHNSNRLKRTKKIRKTIERSKLLNRLTVHRTINHIYAQVIARGGKVVCAASSLESNIKVNKATKIEKAQLVGKLIGQRAKEAKVTKLAFDRSGFTYHGRVKAVAEAARESGLEF